MEVRNCGGRKIRSSRPASVTGASLLNSNNNNKPAKEKDSWLPAQLDKQDPLTRGKFVFDAAVAENGQTSLERLFALIAEKPELVETACI